MIKKQWLLIALCMAVSVMAEFHNAYFFGCSTTDQFVALPEILAGSGDSVEYVKYTVPGCGMECLYKAVGVPASFRGKSWYCMTAAPFANGTELGVNNDVKYISYWYDVALQSNPDCILYVYGMYPGSRWNSCPWYCDLSYDEFWSTHWNRTIDTSLQVWQQPAGGYGTEAYQFMMVKVLREKYPGKKIYMMGVAHVMNAFEQAPFPGFSYMWPADKPNERIEVTGARGLFYDDIHLNNYGQYLQCLTAYATIFRKHPAAAGSHFKGGYGYYDATVPDTFAARAKDFVWNTLTSSALTGYTGVSGTSVVTPPAAAITPVRQAVTPSGLFTLDGRNALTVAGEGRKGGNPAGVYVITRDGLRAAQFSR